MSRTPARGADGRPVPRVLLVEDDPALTQMLAWELEEQGVSLSIARSRAAALALTAKAAFDLAVVDADLPDGDGVSLAEALARANPESIVAICSGRHGIAGGSRRPPAVHVVLTKPVSVRDLLSLLRSG